MALTIPNAGERRLAKTNTRLLFGAAPALGLALALTVAPAHAQSFFDIFNPPQQPYAARGDHATAAERYRRAHRERRREAERRHRKHEAARPKAPPVGPFEIVVAIGPQQALLYGRDGLIATAKISTGRPDHPTPKGVFSVISKSRWHESNIYSGAPMPFMQRITWSGIALHAGPRPGYPASHGCIRLPEDFAVRLFHLTKVGARVIVTQDAVAPASITSPKLFAPAQPQQAPQEKAQAQPVTIAAAGDAAEHMTLAAKSASGKSATANGADMKPSADDKSASDAKTTVGAAAPLATGAIALPPVTPPASDQPKAKGPVSVFVSRKDGKVYVRQGFVELLDMPVTIADPNQPIGTHVYTAEQTIDDGKAMRWTVTSIPSSFPHPRRHAGRRHHRHEVAEAEEAKPAAAATATEALDRITLPPEAVKLISGLLVPGSSLIVSDNPLSDETDDSTNFIVLTP
jgi:hypothetical protein